MADLSVDVCMLVCLFVCMAACLRGTLRVGVCLTGSVCVVRVCVCGAHGRMYLRLPVH